MTNTNTNFNIDYDTYNKNYKQNKITKLFPYISNKSKGLHLKIDDESLNYISVRNISEQITNIIIHHLTELNIDHKTSIVTDATAGVGGNVISFALNFKEIHAIELNSERTEMLVNNTNVYDLKNVKIYNADCIKLLQEINDHHVIFIDPPWGGKNYKMFNKLTLFLSEISIETLCQNLTNENYMKKIPQLIVLKLPKNYDIEFLYQSIDKKNSVYMYDLEKMKIIVIVVK